MADLTLEIYNAAWVTATAYTANQYVSNDSRDYVCILAHTSGATTEPGTGASWTTYWRQSDAKKTLMLARDNGIAMWKSYEVAQDSGNQDKPIWSQTDWSGGFGEGNFNDPSRYSVGSTIDTSHEGYMCLAPELATSSLASGALYSYPRDMCAFGAHGIFMVDGKYVWHWNTTTSKWDNKATCTGARGLCVHDGNMYVACGPTYSYHYTSDGATFTEVTGYYAVAFCSAPPYAGNTPVLWRCSGTNLISSSVDPTDGAEWETDIEVGDTSTKIGGSLRGVGLFIHQGQLFIGKMDGLYHYDSGGVVHKLLNLDPTYYSTYEYPFHSVAQLRGASYFTTATGIGEVTSYNSFSQIEPTRLLNDVDIPDGRYTGLATDGEYLYAAYYCGGPVSYIYKGAEQTDSEGNSRWSWHPIGSYSGGFCFLFSPPNGDDTTRRLWVSTSASTYTMRYMLIPRNPVASAVWASDSLTFTTSGYAETGWIDLGHRDWYKIVDSVLVECRGTMGTVAVAYQADESGSYTTIGTYTATTSGTKDYVATAPFAAKKFKLKFTLTGATTASTPIVKYVAVYGSVRPNRVTLMDFTITAEEGHSASSKGLRDFLIHCRDSTGLHELYDRFGAKRLVRILPGYPTETEYLDATRKQPALGLRVICEEVDWSA